MNLMKSILQRVKEVYENLIIDIGVWVGNLNVKLRKEPRPQYTVDKRKHRQSKLNMNTDAQSTSDYDMLSVERRDIESWLESVRFKTRAFAGVDEADVWNKIAQLNRLYDRALLAERARYDALIAHYRESENVRNCEVEDGDSQEGKQLDCGENNIEAPTESGNEAGVCGFAGESSGDCAYTVSDTVAGVPDCAGAGE